MKKIPTLYVKEYENNKLKKLKRDVTPGLEFILTNPEVIPTIKWDGSCCAIINGEFYKRYDAKQGKTPPESAIPCCEPDPITGHWPHWVKVDTNNPSDKWFEAAYRNSADEFAEGNNIPVCKVKIPDGTYEAVGPHFQNNPYHLAKDVLIKHGVHPITLDMDFDSIREYLRHNYYEGIVFWYNNEPICKIKRKDYGFKWPVE